MNASELVKRIAFSKAYEFLDRDPDQNFLKLVDWLEKLDKDGYVAKQLPRIRECATDQESNWYKLARSLWDDVDDEVRKTLFTNFMINGNLLENQKLVESRKQYRCNIPWAIAMDPTSADAACSRKPGAPDDLPLELSFDEMDDVVTQGKELGTFFYIFTGGEPLLHKDELIALCNKNSDCVFLCITGGLLIDEDFAKELLRVRNMIPLVSVDGFEEETDRRRGKGTFVRIQEAMRILRTHRLVFGVSCRCTGENCGTIGSEAFFDAVIAWGAKAAWFSPYFPVGEDIRFDRMLTSAQRENLIRQILAFRKTKPLLTMDFCSDGRFTGGCIGAGHGYCHISANGDVDPCVFFHCSDSNIRTSSLLQAYQSPLFQRFHEGQPFDENLFRPCPMLDHPERLSDLMGPEEDKSVRDPAMRELPEKCAQTAQEWKIRSDRLWSELK